MRKSLYDIRHMVSKRPYEGQLPKELEEYHYYISDCGHAIMAIPKCLLEEAISDDMDMYEVPVPVKYVLEKGYDMYNNYIIVSAEYDPEFGLIVDDEYNEF